MTDACLILCCAGAVAEMFSNDKYDDNITVPVAVALMLTLLFRA